jgi:hypothetical protein
MAVTYSVVNDEIYGGHIATQANETGRLQVVVCERFARLRLGIVFDKGSFPFRYPCREVDSRQIFHLRHVPTFTIRTGIDGVVKYECSAEHSGHVRDLGRIPVTDGLVK